MPVKIKKVNGKYQVSTPHGVKARGTTKVKAEAQERLLNAIEHGWKPTGRKVRAMTKKTRKSFAAHRNPGTVKFQKKWYF